MINTARTISPSGPQTHEVNVYTDGSVKGGVWGGCAWAIKDEKRGWFDRCNALGREDDVPTTKLQGIRFALEYLVERYEAGYGLGTHVTFHIDCMDALNMLIRLFDTGVPNPRQEDVLRVIMKLLQKLRAHDVGVYFGWLKRCSVVGNDTADHGAGLGSFLSEQGRKGIIFRWGVEWQGNPKKV